MFACLYATEACHISRILSLWQMHQKCGNVLFNLRISLSPGQSEQKQLLILLLLLLLLLL